MFAGFNFRIDSQENLINFSDYTLTLTYAIDGTKKPSVSVTAVCP